jgi:hypothetical protein
LLGVSLFGLDGLGGVAVAVAIVAATVVAIRRGFVVRIKDDRDRHD